RRKHRAGCSCFLMLTHGPHPMGYLAYVPHGRNAPIERSRSRSSLTTSPEIPTSSSHSSSICLWLLEPVDLARSGSRGSSDNASSSRAISTKIVGDTALFVDTFLRISPWPIALRQLGADASVSAAMEPSSYACTRKVSRNCVKAGPKPSQMEQRPATGL